MLLLVFIEVKLQTHDFFEPDI